MQKNVLKRGFYVLVAIYGLLPQCSAAVWPITSSKKITGTYGDYRSITSDIPWGFHTGIDIEASLGTPVLAVANGMVDQIQDDQMYVFVSSGLYHVYAHVQNLVSVGDLVVAGQQIAEVGQFSGEFNHLDFSIADNSDDSIENPLNIFSVEDTSKPSMEGVWIRNSTGSKYFSASAAYPGKTVVWGKIKELLELTDISSKKWSFNPVQMRHSLIYRRHEVF